MFANYDHITMFVTTVGLKNMKFRSFSGAGWIGIHGLIKKYLGLYHTNFGESIQFHQFKLTDGSRILSKVNRFKKLRTNIYCLWSCVGWESNINYPIT